MKKSLKKLLPTLALVVVTASLMGTATFAWFTMNTTATVTGPKVNIETYDNLLVAPASGNYRTPEESSFKNTLTITEASTKIAPVSSIDAKNFYYIDNRNATAAGNVIVEDYKEYGDGTAFGTAYNSAVGYKDFNFELKAINGNTAEDVLDLRLTRLDLQYTGNQEAAVNKSKALRVAVFMTEQASTYPTTVVGATFGEATAVEATGSLKSIYAPDGAETFTRNPDNAKNKAVSAGPALADVDYNVISKSAALDADKQFSTLADKTVKYFKVTVRVWIEGEDTTCFNEAYVLLDEDWHLDIAFDLVPSTDTENNVEYLNIANHQPGYITMATGVLTATLTNGKATTNAKYQWYKGATPIANATEATYTLTADDLAAAATFTCAITADDLSVYNIGYSYVPTTITYEAGVLTATLTSGKSATYAWKKGDAAITGATSATYIPVEEGNYKCVITSDAVDYTTAVVAVAAPTKVVAVNGTLEAYIVNGLSGTATYAWYKVGDPDDVDLSTDTFDFTPTEAGKYYCVITVGTSAFKTEETSISKPDLYTFALAGNHFSAGLGNGKTEASYKWYKVGDPDDELMATTVEGEFIAPGAGTYYCVITDTEGRTYKTVSETIS